MEETRWGAVSSGSGWLISTLRADACPFHLNMCADFTQFIIKEKAEEAHAVRYKWMMV
jgi:hypothetical protein